MCPSVRRKPLKLYLCREVGGVIDVLNKKVLFWGLKLDSVVAKSLGFRCLCGADRERGPLEKSLNATVSLAYTSAGKQKLRTRQPEGQTKKRAKPRKGPNALLLYRRYTPSTYDEEKHSGWELICSRGCHSLAPTSPPVSPSSSFPCPRPCHPFPSLASLVSFLPWHP